MNELSIRFTAEKDDAPISASLVCLQDGTMTNPAPFEPPLGDAELAELRWYLELFSVWPMQEDYHRAERIEAQLEDWGRVLRNSLIGQQADAARLWGQFLSDGAENKLLTIDATDPRVLRLPWELLADEGGHIFANGIGVRRRLQQISASASKPFSLPIRVLMLVSRPDDVGFIDPRVETIALLDVFDQLGAQAKVEFLYPPTLKALTSRLRDKHLPPVHVLHFDGHGVYDSSLGLGYLLFENDKHRSDRVDANRLGTLLNRCGVPLMVLNACQSAKQEESNPYASVAARLIRASVGSVLAMNYSVLVVAAKKFVEAFYRGLVQGLTIGKAVDEGRYALLADEERHTITRSDKDGKHVEEIVRLRDWFLPALYQQSTDPVVFAPLPEEAKEQSRAESQIPHLGEAESQIPLLGGVRGGFPTALTDPTVPGGLPQEPRHGFHGRAREMLKLERALAEHAIVILHGFGGTGKTALATEAGRWFYRNGRFPGGAAFVSFEGGGSLQQLCSWVGQALSGDPDFVIGDGDPVQRVAALLQERPALVILDNFESVLGRDPLMPPEELQVVLDAVWNWATPSPRPYPQRGEGANAPLPLGEGPGVRGKILITTRDTNFNDSRFGPSKRCAQIELGGLDQWDALELAAAVLEDYGIDRSTIRRQELVDLMERLGGHPLSLYLALPHLRDNRPAELSKQFETLLPGFTSGAAKKRNESLTVSLEFSLRRLGAATREALPALAVFEGGAMEDGLLAITEIDPELWKAARTELEQAALLSVEPIPNVNAPFLRFHPTLVPYLAGRLSSEKRAALEERYRERYYAVSGFLVQSDTQHPHEARAIALLEMPNLKRAFELWVKTLTPGPSPKGRGESTPSPSGGEGWGEGYVQAAATAVDFTKNIARFLNYFGRWRERDALLARVADLHVSSEEGLTYAEFLMLSQRGDVLLQQGQAAQAEQIFRDLLVRLETGAAYDATYDRGLALWWLGSCLEKQGRPAQAIEWHDKALQVFEALSPSNESAKEMLGKVFTKLGDNLAATGRFDEAQRAYEDGLEVSRAVDDHRSVGIKLMQLGTLAMERRDLQEAARRYSEALRTFHALGEPQSEAVVWHQLGMVAQETKEWDEAERCYREALKFWESFHDLLHMAMTCNHLAVVAKGTGRLDDAERWYLRAQEIKDQVSPHDASTLNNLADLYLSQKRLEKAEHFARRAVEIKEQLDLSAEPWTTYNILAEIAAERGKTAEAASWQRKANESQDAFEGTKYHIERILRQFQPVIEAVAAACEGNAEARITIEEQFDSFKRGNWQIVDAIQRIWAGERDANTLTADIDYNSRAIVLAILARLAGEAPASASGAASPSAEEEPEEGEKGLSLEDFLALVKQACQPDAPAGLAEQMHSVTRMMADDPAQPQELRTLGTILNTLLSGEREPDLSALPPQLADLVRNMLAAL